MATAKQTENPNSAVSPPPQKKQNDTELPEEIILFEILARIPAKNLMGLKCVSPQWNSFISYPSALFGNAHLSLSSTSNSKSVLTILGCPYFEFFGYVDYEKVVGSSLAITKFGTNIHRHVPFWLLSSCNGLGFLICVHMDKLICKCKDKSIHLPDNLPKVEFYLVCNPLLGIDSFVEIDHPHDQIRLDDSDEGFHYFNFGFGYVSSLDDYYIVVIRLFKGLIPHQITVHMYSLRLLRWTPPRKHKQDGLPLRFHSRWYNEIGTLVKETLHWGVTVGENQKCIAAFDLAAQDEIKFMQLPYPDFGKPQRPEFGPCFCLCCMDGCLCAWGNYADDDGIGDVIEMWMMNIYGMQESWTKLFRCNVGCYPRNIFGFTKAGMVLFNVPRDTELRLIDVSCAPPRDVHIVVKNILEAVNYVQSLVSPLAIMSEQKE